jgi:hypothetical protein
VNRKRIIVVLGMHRSGSSTVAKSLETLGVSLGNNLLSADEFNVKGYFEDKDLYCLNEQIMVSIGSFWDLLNLPDESTVRELCSTPYFGMAVELVERKLKEPAVLGIKDPRLCIMLPFWQQVFERAGGSISYVITFRNPLGVAESLLNRNQMLLVKSCWLWVIYVVKSLVYTDGAPRIVVDYDELLVNPEIQIEKMAAALQLQVQPDRMKEYLTEFLGPGFNHYRKEFDKTELFPDFPPLAEEIYLALKSLSEGKLSESGIRELAEGWKLKLESFRELLAMSSAFEHELRKMTSIADERHRLIVEYQRQPGEKDSQINDLTRELNSKNGEITGLRKLLEESDLRDEMFRKDLSEQIAITKYLNENIQQKSSEITDLRVTCSSKEEIIRNIRNSLSWRITAPLRRLSAIFPGWKSQVSGYLIYARIIWLHRRSGYFDSDWYVSRYPDVKATGKNPLIHFARYGIFQERCPNPEFDSQNYLSLNPDVALFGKSPVIHFILHGFREQRSWKNGKVEKR